MANPKKRKSVGSAMVYGIDKTIERFKLYQCCNFGFFQGDDLIFSHEDDTVDKAAIALHRNLQALEPGIAITYALKMYKVVDDEGIDSDTPYSGMFTFKTVDRMDHSGTDITPYEKPAPNEPKNTGDIRWMNWLEGEVRRLNAELKEKQIELDEANDTIDELGDAADQGDERLGVIGSLIKEADTRPWLQDIVKQGAGILTDMFNFGKTRPPADVRMNGVPNSTPEENKKRFEAAIEKMHAYYVKKYGDAAADEKFSADIKKLADLTDNAFMFEMVIDKLRTM